MTCPVPNGHDKYRESIYFFHRMHECYHRPNEFKYNLHAYLNALYATPLLIRNDMERIGLVKPWKEFWESREKDPLLENLKKIRDKSTHQLQIQCDSKVSVGIFRDRKLKLGVEQVLDMDTPSVSLLNGAVDHLVGKLIDFEHSAIGEQIGVRRYYFEKTIGEEEDLLTSVRKAVTRVSKYLTIAHELGGAKFIAEDEESLYPKGWADEVTVLLETDVDPELVNRWEW